MRLRGGRGKGNRTGNVMKPFSTMGRGVGGGIEDSANPMGKGKKSPLVVVGSTLKPGKPVTRGERPIQAEEEIHVPNEHTSHFQM